MLTPTQTPTLVVLVGLPGSGKSTEAAITASVLNFTIISSDEIRMELYNKYDTTTQENEAVFNTMYKRMKQLLTEGRNVILDATNLRRKYRMHILNQIVGIDCVKLCSVIATPFNVCLQQNKTRERKVPTNIIDNMYKNFQIPMYQEGWDRINILYSQNYNRKDYSTEEIKKFFSFLSGIDQHNPHHSETIGNHCIDTQILLLSSYAGEIVFEAGMLHDIGKYKTMSFRNHKGEYSQQAHYYGHESVSAYDAMFWLRDKYENDYDDHIVKICALINEHMRPYSFNNESDKSIEKYKKFVGEVFYKDLILLHEADKNRYWEDTETNETDY